MKSRPQTRKLTTAAIGAVAALAATLVAAPAAARYRPPDLVRVPIERLVGNLERDLAAATEPAARAELLIALGRLHAAAWAMKADALDVMRDVDIGRDAPTIVAGKLSADEVMALTGNLFAGGDALLATLAQPCPRDPAHSCDPAAVGRVVELSGDVTLELATAKRDAPLTVKVKATSLTEPAVARCLAAKLEAFGPWAPRPGRTVARVRFTFTPRDGKPRLRPFYGFGQSPTPRGVAPGTDASTAAAKVHLEAARARYDEAVALVPDDVRARLGRAWALDQLGLRADAVAAYRDTFARAWANEKDLDHLGLGARPIAAEAADYLVALLDAERDAAEIATLRAASEKLERLPRPITPIVIPLAADATLASVVAPDAGVAFDLDGTGRMLRWGWLTPRAGWLVYDGLGDGRVTSAIALFGSASFLCPWADGYRPLAALDDDGDGALAGPELRHLALWVDADMDGQSDPGEVSALTDLGVVALATAAARDADGVLGNPSGVVMADGSTRPSWDWVVPPGQ